MRERRFGRIINITSAMVKSPNPMMTLSIGARTGLTGVMKALSKQVVVDNVTINNLLPERFDTDRQRYMAELAMQFGGITWDEARAQQVATIAAGRLGRPNELGDLCAYLCSVQASYVSGQNIGLDGGSYEGLI
jgi:3-oxoacyl-[acyl-carrier protein] reductase